MAQAKVHGVHPVAVNSDNTPNHMIIWLDKHIGKWEECVLLKKSFVMTMDPTTHLFERKLAADDIDRSICMETSVLIQLDDVEFVFRAFDDILKCYECIKENIHKRIFLITSGSIGKIIVPSLVKLHPEAFSSENPIFIFCANLLMVPVKDITQSNLWLHELIENVLPFDHQDDLLTRMIREMAKYFNAEAERFRRDQEQDKADQYQDWSQRMHNRHEALKKQYNK